MNKTEMKVMRKRYDELEGKIEDRINKLNGINVRINELNNEIDKERQRGERLIGTIEYLQEERLELRSKLGITDEEENNINGEIPEGIPVPDPPHLTDEGSDENT